MKSGALSGVVIGAGYFAPFHLEAWARIPGVEIAAVADLVENRAQELATRFGLPRHYKHWRQMIDDERPDFVDIVTPPDTHEEMCLYAASRGVHIVCQKPLAPTLEEGERIVTATASSGVRFMVHENWRWQPWYRVIKHIQNTGEIGVFTHAAFQMRLGDGWGENAYLARQPFFRDYPRLLIYETGVHFIDTFRYLLGEVATVFATVQRLNPAIRGEDAAQLMLTFESGATALWDANRYNETEASSPRLTFGRLRVDAGRGHLELDADARIRLKPLGAPGRDVDYVWHDRSFAGDCVYFLQSHFVERLRDGLPFECDGEDYLRTTRVMEAAYESVRTGQTVRLIGGGLPLSAGA